MDDLLQEFVAETRETLEALAGEIVAWEAAPGDRSRLDSIFRFVHTVKGSCGFLDLPRLGRLSHAAEDALMAVRDGRRGADPALVTAVLAVVDRIGELVEAIDAGVALDDASDDLLIGALDENASPVLPSAAASVVPAVLRAPTRSIRLHVDLLDRMMSGMSDMVLARNELARRLREDGADPRVDAALERLSATVAEMRDTVTRTRMQKIEALFAAIPRMVRDTAAELGKAVVLSIDGGDVELDREMIEMLRDPLTHIVRNAIDHGIELPAARRAAGKAETGRLCVSARQSGNQILVEVADDGAGIDVARVAAKAVTLGLRDQAAVAAMGEQERLDLVFAPGLSSRDTVTAISGRGVGMDVVRANIEQIGGRVELVNRPGRGLILTIQVPLTLSIISTVVLGVGAQRFALPRQAVEEIVSLRAEAVRVDRVGGATLATVRGERLPLVRLADVLGLAAPAASMIAIVTIRDGRFALAFDAVLDTEELVIKPAAPAITACGLYAGQTLPDSGRPMLLLDGPGLAQAAGLRLAASVPAAGAEVEAAEEPGVPALMFDDLDGRRRLVTLATVDRVETVPAGSIAETAGCLRLSIDGALIPLRRAGPLDLGRAATVLRLSDGERSIGYAIAEPLDIVTLPAELAPAVGEGPIAGVALIDGQPLELVDAHALFAATTEAAPAAELPLCLLHDDEDGWMANFLKPVIEAAGYRCVTRQPGKAPVALALSMAETPPAGVPTIRLSRAAPTAAGVIHRYDRPALLTALAERRAAGARP